MSQTTDNPAKTELAPFEILEVMLDNSTIKFHEPLVLVPTRMPDEPGDVEYWEVEVPELGISAYGVDYEDLWDCIQSCVRMVWKEYVREDDRNLAPLAKTYKNAYLAIAEEIDE